MSLTMRITFWLLTRLRMISVVSAYCGLLGMTKDFLDNLEGKLPVDSEFILVNAGGEPIEHEVVTKRVDLPVNKSFSNSMNAGIREAKGDYVIIIGNDVFPETSDWCEELVNCCFGEVGISAPVFDYPSLKDYEHKCLRGNEKFHFMSFYPAVCWCMPRKVIEEVGLFDELFELGCFEDNDYAKRVIDKGYKIIVNKRVCMIHLGGATMKSLCDVKSVHDENLKRFNDKWSGSQS